MKIYFASQSFYPHIGGVSTYLLNLARELVNRENEVVEVHLRPLGEADADEIRGIEVHRVPKIPLDRQMLENYSKFKEAIYKECHTDKGSFNKPATEMEGYDDYNKINTYFGEEMRSLLEHHPAEIVHVHDFQLMYLYKFVPRGTPLVMTWHIPFDEDINKHLKEFLIKHMTEYDKIIFSSKDYIKAAVKAGLPKEKTELIYPICNTKLFKKMDIDKTKVRKKYKIPVRCKMIMCVQRIDAKSGHEQLIRAMPKILKEVRNTKLIFVGGESMSTKISKERLVYQNRVKDLIKKLKLNKHIIFTGNIEYTKLPELYNAADVVALTSKLEGFGLSVTEGMACGKPIIGTKVGGIPIQVRDGYNGFLVDVNDTKNTAIKIIKLLNDDNLRQKIGTNSLKLVKEKFDMEISVDKHLILYNQLLKEKHESKRIEELDVHEIKAFIADYDRTLTAKPGVFKREVLRKLKSLNTSLILVTGRTFQYVQEFLKKFKGWRCIIAENGAIIYFPKTSKKIIITNDYVEEARELLKKHKIKAKSGEVVVSTSLDNLPKIKKILEKYEDKLDYKINVDELMILPKGVDKGQGIKIALEHMNIDPEKTILVGDGENDIEMFNIPGFKIAVANAYEKLKLLADDVTEKPNYKGVLEIIEKLKK